MRSFYDVIRRPLITEKANIYKEARNTYLFEVPINVNKQEIRQAVEAVFNVKVESVRTCIVRGKIKRIGRFFGKRPNWKKAYVKLQKGYTIDIFQGV